MSDTALTVKEAVSALSERMRTMDSDDLARVADVAKTGRTQVWGLKKGTSTSRLDVVLRVEEAVTRVEQEREV